MSRMTRAEIVQQIESIALGLATGPTGDPLSSSECRVRLKALEVLLCNGYAQQPTDVSPEIESLLAEFGRGSKPAEPVQPTEAEATAREWIDREFDQVFGT